MSGYKQMAVWCWSWNNFSFSAQASSIAPFPLLWSNQEKYEVPRLNSYDDMIEVGRFHGTSRVFSLEYSYNKIH